MVSAEAATGWHVMKVQGYSKYRAAGGVGRVVTSGAFTVGGRTWRVLYFPNGYPGKENASWEGFGLRDDGGGAGGGGGRARFTLRLIGEDGAPRPSWVWSYTPEVSRLLVFPAGRGTERYFGQFIRVESFNSMYDKADCFRIRCDIAVDPKTGDELHRHLGSILASGVGGDVTFEVGKETFVAHKNVLAARSPVFMEEFFGGTRKEKAAATAAHVHIHGIDARAFKAFLHFIYTDSLPEIAEGDQVLMAQNLLVAADRYGMERLKPICLNKLCMYVNASAAVTTLVLAEQHGCRRLKEACFNILKSGDNFKALGYDDYNYLMRGCPSVLNELIAENGL